MIQVPADERVILITPGYLKNLTEILATEPKRNVANYMMWRAARASVSFLSKAAREISEEYTQRVTGQKTTSPRQDFSYFVLENDGSLKLKFLRWKKCVESASSSFSAAVGKMYVERHFRHEAKETMLEMVADIREEFKQLLNEVRGELRKLIKKKF